MRAIVMELEVGGGKTIRGEFKFQQIPSPGDRLAMPAVEPGGEEYVLSVLYVEHYPIAKDGRASGGFAGMVIVVGQNPD